MSNYRLSDTDYQVIVARVTDQVLRELFYDRLPQMKQEIYDRTCRDVSQHVYTEINIKVSAKINEMKEEIDSSIKKVYDRFEKDVRKLYKMVDNNTSHGKASLRRLNRLENKIDDLTSYLRNEDEEDFDPEEVEQRKARFSDKKHSREEGEDDDKATSSLSEPIKVSKFPTSLGESPKSPAKKKKYDVFNPSLMPELEEYDFKKKSDDEKEKSTN